MKGLVVYHTKWGNCKKIAEMIAQGLQESGHEITVISTDEKKVGSDFDFIAAGSGTRAGHMTGAMKRFLRSTINKGWKGKPFIAFGTGGKPKGDSKYDKMAAKSAERIYDFLQKKDLVPVTEAYKAYVEDMKGPLTDGEEERAVTFGRDAGKALSST